MSRALKPGGRWTNPREHREPPGAPPESTGC